MRDSLHKTKFVYEASKYYSMLAAKGTELHDIYPVNSDCVMVTYSEKEEYNTGNSVANLAVAAFTTSHARLVLLEMMTKLGDRLLYYDTDSVIYVSRPTDTFEPVEGYVLGQWSNEMKNQGEYITRLVSLGPKVRFFNL
jgi:hypothetical protein